VPGPADVAAQKQVLRGPLLAARRARPDAARAAAAEAVTAALLAGLGGARVVATSVPLPEEPGAGRLPGALAAPGRSVLLPVVPPEGSALRWAELDGRPLERGRFGLLQPAPPHLPPEALGAADVVVVPALAVARDGTRLGRGGGYYDRALAHAGPAAVLVAVVFDGELVDALPAEPHDRRVTAVVTPSSGWVDLDRA
jgi:5-formyltetrahydrofolate cyclo-ligase